MRHTPVTTHVWVSAGSSSGEMCLILREWMDKMPQDHEFRCFVHNKRITGISQYHCYYPFEALQDR
jgi:hypothetical protein